MKITTVAILSALALMAVACSATVDTPESTGTASESIQSVCSNFRDMTGTYRFTYTPLGDSGAPRLTEDIPVINGVRQDFVPCTSTVHRCNVFSTTCNPSAFGTPTDTSADVFGSNRDGTTVGGTLTIQTSSWNAVGVKISDKTTF